MLSSQRAAEIKEQAASRPNNSSNVRKNSIPIVAPGVLPVYSPVGAGSSSPASLPSLPTTRGEGYISPVRPILQPHEVILKSTTVYYPPNNLKPKLHPSNSIDSLGEGDTPKYCAIKKLFSFNLGADKEQDKHKNDSPLAVSSLKPPAKGHGKGNYLGSSPAPSPVPSPAHSPERSPGLFDSDEGNDVGFDDEATSPRFDGESDYLELENN